VLIDDEDATMVARYKWHLLTKRTRSYAATNLPDGPRHPDGRRNRRKLLMHNLLCPPPPGRETDHKNGDGLDNRRHNLRTATRTQNNANQGKRPNATSAYKGVSRKAHAHSRPWVAAIKHAGHAHHLGYYPTPEHAARAYDAAARELFGEYARPNFTEEA
jgi:hypothetical protein